MKGKFETAALGGTFDKLHKGHKAFLMKAFEIGKYVYIGLSTDEFVEKSGKNHKVATYNERRVELEAFLRGRGVLDRAEIFPLQDPYGVTISRRCLEAIVVSRETESRAHEINLMREAKGFRPLSIIVVETVLAENGISISTTRIRRKEIDRSGRLLSL